MFTAKKAAKRSEKMKRKNDKLAIKEIYQAVRTAANNGDDYRCFNKAVWSIDEDFAEKITEYFTALGYEVDNHEGYTFIEISW